MASADSCLAQKELFMYVPTFQPMMLNRWSEQRPTSRLAGLPG